MSGMTMVEQNEMLQKAEDGIKAELNQDVPRPSRDLIESVKKQGIDEYFVRAALLFLLDAGRIEFTNGRNLRLTTG